MKEIEEQISKIIGDARCNYRKAIQGPTVCISNEIWANKILSEVTIEVECSDFKRQRKIIGDWKNTFRHHKSVTKCKACNNIGKQTITLKEAIERLK